MGFLGSFSNHELEKLVAATMSNTRSPAKRRESAVFRTGPSGIAVVFTLRKEGSADIPPLLLLLQDLVLLRS